MYAKIVPPEKNTSFIIMDDDQSSDIQMFWVLKKSIHAENHIPTLFSELWNVNLTCRFLKSI